MRSLASQCCAVTMQETPERLQTDTMSLCTSHNGWIVSLIGLLLQSNGTKLHSVSPDSKSRAQNRFRCGRKQSPTMRRMGRSSSRTCSGLEPGYTVGDERLGVMLSHRLFPPRETLGGLEPDRILLGHGGGVFDDASSALADSLAGARKRFPRALVTQLGTNVRLLTAAVND